MFAHSVNAPYEDYKLTEYVELLWIIKTAIIYGHLLSILHLFIRPYHTTYVNAAYCYRPSSVVCRSVRVVSPANSAELMQFGFRTRVGPRNHALDGVPHSLTRRRNF